MPNHPSSERSSVRPRRTLTLPRLGPVARLACLGLFVAADASAATQVYYSVGQSTALDLRTGVPTCSVVGTTLTFNLPQTDTRFGVGAKVTYGGANVCYVSGKSSATVWSCVTAKGVTPPAAASGTAVNSIRHAFASLQAARTGMSGASFLNGTDLVAGNYVVNLPCYYDTGPDTTPLVLDGYITGPTNYIRIYTPTDTALECNQSQRHDGKWNNTRFRMQVPDYQTSISVG